MSVIGPVAIETNVTVRIASALVHQPAPVAESGVDGGLARPDAERLRIARELHDVVAHTMAIINVQSSVAVHVMAEQPETAAEAMRAVKAASKEGLRELRAILDVLHRADAEGVAPTPA
jgi:signal transduction histidine kinase